MHKVLWSIIFLALFFVAGCASDTYAPVVEFSSIEPLPKKGYYTVKRDDTLYSIAWRYGLDYRYLAQLNNIDRPYHIEAGQLLYLHKVNKKPFHKKIIKPKKLNVPIEKEPTASVSYWHWPAKGPVIGKFSPSNKGINIGGVLGNAVFAAAPGKVVYSGNGLRAYGNLIIIKHNSLFLTAYAHNNCSLVKEGEWVAAGQKIAEMGDTGARRIMLHFEIRRSGKPVNPLLYLKK